MLCFILFQELKLRFWPESDNEQDFLIFVISNQPQHHKLKKLITMDFSVYVRTFWQHVGGKNRVCRITEKIKSSFLHKEAILGFEVRVGRRIGVFLVGICLIPVDFFQLGS